MDTIINVEVKRRFFVTVDIYQRMSERKLNLFGRLCAGVAPREGEGGHLRLAPPFSPFGFHGKIENTG